MSTAGQIPGAGGTPPRPLQAPQAVTSAAVQPGTSGAVVAQQVIIIGTGGELLVYSPTAGPGNLIASISGSSALTTDSFGNGVMPGISAYQWVSGHQYVESLSTQIASSAALTFDNLSNRSFAPPAVYGNAQSGIGKFDQVVLQSGQQTSGDTPSSISVESSLGGGSILITSAGVIAMTAGTNVTIGLSGTITITGATAISATGAAVSCQSVTTAGDISVQGTDLFLGNGATANFTLNPKMAIPPNYPTAGKTLAQTQAFCDGLFAEMEGRGMFT
jgi:hypothetical protein